MNPSASLWSTVSLQRAAKAAAALVISIGVLVLIGWATNIGVLKSVLPNLVSMKPNTAVSFVLAGTALRLTTPPTTPKRQRVGQLCALAVALIGLVSLSQDLLGWNLGIDQMLFVEDPQSSGTLSPGRMSPLTAFCFILGGSALGLSVAQRRRILMGWLCPAEALAVLTCLVAAQVLVAYLYGAQPVVGVLPYTQMALHAAINFMLLTSGILMSRPRQGLISIVVADSVGGAVARRLLPAAIAVPLLLGGFRIVTANLGLFAPDLGTSLLAVLHTVIFAGVVLWTAHQMHRIDRQRQAALEALSRANEDLEARIQERTAKLEEANRFFQLSHELMSIVGPDGYFKQLNPAWESVLGYSQPELLARPFLSFVHPADLEITRAATVCRGANRPATAFENRYRCRDGSYRWLSWITVIVADNCLVYLTARDVTDRKQAEQRLAEQVAIIQQQAELLELTNEAIFVRDRQGAITYWNRGAETLYGWSRQEATGQVTHSLLQTHGTWNPDLSLDALVQQRGDWQGELTQTCKNGEQIIVESRQVLIRDDRGAPTGFLEVNRDITERKQSQRVQQQLATIVENSPDLIATAAMDGYLCYLNPAGRALVGLGPEDRVDQLHNSQFHPLEVQDRLRSLMAALMEHGVWRGEMVLRHWQSDEPIPVYQTAFVIRDRNTQQPLNIATVIRDIRDRKRSEEALRESEERFRRAILEAPLPVMLHAEDGEVLQVNHAWCDLTGYRPEDLRTTADWSERAYGSRKERVDADIERLHHLEQRVAEGEYWVQTRFGENRIWDFFSAPLGSLPDGRSLVISTAIDVTERRQAEAELQQLNATLEQRVEERTAQLQETNRDLEAFSYTVAHDLRAPLRGIQGFAQALVEDYGEQLDDTARQYIQAIFDGTHRMNDLVRDLLAYSRLSREQVRLARVQLGAVVAAAQAQLEADLQPCQAELTVAADLPCVIGQQAILVQMMANLLSNAVKFVAPEQRPKVRVWVENCIASDTDAESSHNDSQRNLSTPMAQRVRLWVEDNGIGIAPEYQEQVFGVFERLHSRDAYPGTGIGLAIVRKGAERLNGRAGVESVPGRGSRFWIELQRAA